MDAFTLALYVVLMVSIGVMVYRIIQQARQDNAENKRSKRLNNATRSDFTTKHGKRYGRRK